MTSKTTITHEIVKLMSLDLSRLVAELVSSLVLGIGLALGFLLVSGNLPHGRLHRTSWSGGDLHMRVQSVAQSTESAGPAAAGISLATGDRCPIAGIPEKAHYVLVIALGSLNSVVVLGLLGQKLLPLHLRFHLRRHIRNNKLHDASNDKNHVLKRI